MTQNRWKTLRMSASIAVLAASLFTTSAALAEKEIREQLALTFDSRHPIARSISVPGTRPKERRIVSLKLPNGEPFTASDGYCVLSGFRSVHNSFVAFAAVSGPNAQWKLVASGGIFERPKPGTGLFTCIRFEK